MAAPGIYFALVLERKIAVSAISSGCPATSMGMAYIVIWRMWSGVVAVVVFTECISFQSRINIVMSWT